MKSLSESYIQYGIPSNWAHNFELNNISISTFRQTSRKNLVEKYKIPEPQIDFVKKCLQRSPIDSEVIYKLLTNNRFTCCLCKGQKSDAYIIHHIVEYSLTQDNKYKNLAVLCPNDHDLAHREGISLTSKISIEQVRKAKQEWEAQVKRENKKSALNGPVRNLIKDWKQFNPYKELQSFSEDDYEFFFGRSVEISELSSTIRKHNIVGLFGESGTGKTSLINAGLLPYFKREGFITIAVRCLDEPIKRIKEELFRTLRTNNVPKDSIEELAVANTFPHLVAQLKQILQKEDINLIIVVDQFEEIFTRASDDERRNLSKGITELLIVSPLKSKLYFILSLREDYIGALWDWAHLYNIENAWIHQYRIKRLSEEKATEAVINPLYKLGIKTDVKFITQIIKELQKIGDELIYPPYLQIVCSKLYEEYIIQNTNVKPTIEFGQHLYGETDVAEVIILEYLSESMLQGLTDEEKNQAKNILDLLTGPQGLRTFLTSEEISRYIHAPENHTLHVIEHLIKKKIIHAVVENETVVGYELIHDFLSKSFFDKLSPDAQRKKTVEEIFRKAFREWKQHDVLASKDRMEILLPNVKQLVLNDENWFFLIKSSFSVYWHFENEWKSILKPEKMKNICMSLIHDKDERIITSSISTLGRMSPKEVTPVLIDIIKSPEASIPVKESAINQFSFFIKDKRIIDVLQQIVQNDRNYKLRKAAVYAFGKNVSVLPESEAAIKNKGIQVLIDALNDSMTQVRKEVTDIVSYSWNDEAFVMPLIKRFKVETSIVSKKGIVSALGTFVRRKKSIPAILPLLRKISSDKKEDYRVREEAKNAISLAIKES
jgi:ABC-type dipeptide/oligopeptide/nickel transport system ATPase subunit